MASLLNASAQTQDLTVISLVTQSAENLGYCLQNLLKAGAVISTGNFGTGLQAKVRAKLKMITLGPSSSL